MSTAPATTYVEVICQHFVLMSYTDRSKIQAAVLRVQRNVLAQELLALRLRPAAP